MSTLSNTSRAIFSDSSLFIPLTCLSPNVIFSKTLRCEKSSNDWKTIPILERISLTSAKGLFMISPFNFIIPFVGSISLLIHLSTVDFPLPDEPMIATDSPFLTLNETPLTA